MKKAERVLDRHALNDTLDWLAANGWSSLAREIRDELATLKQEATIRDLETLLLRRKLRELSTATTGKRAFRSGS